MAIECDGDRYYPLDKLPEDMDRQSVLERMGWIFTRIRSSEFLRKPVRAMKPVFEKPQTLEIPPAGTLWTLNLRDWSRMRWSTA